jgi:sec-independent protein translocase protein TatA
MPRAGERPADALDGPRTECEEQEPEGEKAEDEPALHGFQATTLRSAVHQPRRGSFVILAGDLAVGRPNDAVYAGAVPGHWELIALGIVILLLFGSKQLPQIARNLGRGVREVRETIVDVDPRTQMRQLEAPADEEPAESGAKRSPGPDDDV